ncbi:MULTISPECIES: transposase [unclassified Mucilaginibacter]|uniref:transposase n=2 Tax=unclassified Mucilaginibacter TaxID=2617802 RepID=UPI002B228DB1|nr:MULTISPECIES: transposase [unclassified Mucilaginibacter]MEB0277961.1 transposase [Mucilaginibacter sp. 10B2]MEB0299686.1 transposase [Mucilaginibacter sp. 5C4]
MRREVSRRYDKMEDKYKNKHRVSSARLEGWDYGSHASYFVTICTKDRAPYFGKIETTLQGISSLQKTHIANVAYDNWLKIPEYHPYVELDEFIIMPDHIHGILFINKPDKITWELNKAGSQSKNLASVIRGYKSAVKQYAMLNDIDFTWQPRYYDRVIRDQKEYLNIQEYIYDNPDKWEWDGKSFENLYKP